MVHFKGHGLLAAAYGVTAAMAACSADYLVDDFSKFSENRNNLGEWASDDGTMSQIAGSNGALAFTPKEGGYFYETFPCQALQSNSYTYLQVDVKGPSGGSFSVELEHATSCSDTTSSQARFAVNSVSGNWQSFRIPLTNFAGANLNAVKSIIFGSFSSTSQWQLDNVLFVCGKSGGGSPATTGRVVTSTSKAGTAAAPTATVAGFVIDTFSNSSANSLGVWHGTDNMQLNWGSNRLTLKSTDADYSFYTQFSNTCKDMRSYSGAYLHISFSGHTKFSIALQQHNSQCKDDIAPFPETWDSLDASRYAKGNDIYIPISHFNINLQRVKGLAIKSFYTTDQLVLNKIEIVNSVPSGFSIPSKNPSGTLVFACTRPNSFAFAIDDGSPQYAQKVAQIIRDAGIKVTFFTVGQPLEDTSNGLANIYRTLKNEGHQLALHSYTHPKMESLPDIKSIDYEYNQDIKVMANTFNGFKSNYFRPPYGTEGARMRERWAATSGSSNPYLINWSVDIEDWKWAETSTPNKQLDAFKRDLAKGGNLVVMHYLYNSTVQLMPEFIKLAKATGKKLMRVDQCMQDPNAPAL